MEARRQAFSVLQNECLAFRMSEILTHGALLSTFPVMGNLATPLPTGP
jgi:hypothetical protein